MYNRVWKLLTCTINVNRSSESKICDYINIFLKEINIHGPSGVSK